MGGGCSVGQGSPGDVRGLHLQDGRGSTRLQEEPVKMRKEGLASTARAYGRGLVGVGEHGLLGADMEEVLDGETGDDAVPGLSRVGGVVDGLHEASHVSFLGEHLYVRVAKTGVAAVCSVVLPHVDA